MASELGISREASDQFAVSSQHRYAAALRAGFFDDEITAIVGGTARAPETITRDEQPRPEVTPEALAKLRPLAPGGIVTAGNASGINDDAAALMIGARRMGERYGTAPQARIVAAATAGVPPRIMGLGPVPAIGKVLDRAGLSLADMDVIEMNEAFAPLRCSAA